MSEVARNRKKWPARRMWGKRELWGDCACVEVQKELSGKELREKEEGEGSECGRMRKEKKWSARRMWGKTEP